MTTGDPAGTRVYARSFSAGNRVATDHGRMDALRPLRHSALLGLPSRRRSDT